MVQAFEICIKITNTQTEYKIKGWPKLDDIIVLFVLAGTPCCLCSGKVVLKTQIGGPCKTTKLRVVLTTQIGGPHLNYKVKGGPYNKNRWFLQNKYVVLHDGSNYAN